MDNPLISVILPTRRRARIIRAAIDSVLRQTYSEIELLVGAYSDDQETLDILSAYDDDRLRVIVNGIGAAGEGAMRNLLAFRSHGEFIFNMADRARLEKDTLRVLVKDFLDIKHSGCEVAAIGPRIANGWAGPVKPRQPPVSIGAVTGIIYFDWGWDTGVPVRAQQLHTDSLIPRDAWVAVGGYSRYFQGRDGLRSETDLFERLKRHGELYFDPKAKITLVTYTRGGSRGLHSTLTGGIYYIRNTWLYLLSNHKYPCVPLGWIFLLMEPRVRLGRLFKYPV